MKAACGFLLIIAGIALGLYVGLWWAFIGGIMDVVREVRAPELSEMNLAIGVAKIVCAGFIGYVSAMVLVLPGIALLDS